MTKKNEYRTSIIPNTRLEATNEKLRRNGFGRDVFRLQLGNGTVTHYGVCLCFIPPREGVLNPRHVKWMTVLRGIISGVQGGRLIEKNLEAALVETGLKKRKKT